MLEMLLRYMYLSGSVSIQWNAQSCAKEKVLLILIGSIFSHILSQNIQQPQRSAVPRLYKTILLFESLVTRSWPLIAVP